MNTCAFGTGIAGVRARLFGITALPTRPSEPPFAAPEARPAAARRRRSAHSLVRDRQYVPPPEARARRDDLGRPHVHLFLRAGEQRNSRFPEASTDA
jgi:hypothetical protein